MTQTADAVIIGGGIVGAACANELTKDGLRVCVVEAAVAGGGATAAGMGHIVIMDDSEPQFALTNYSRALWNELSADLPHEVEFERRGTLWVAADSEEMEAVLQKQSYYTQRGVAVEVLDGRQLENAEPMLRPGLTGALLVPDDAVLYAPCAAQWLLEQASLRGAAIRTGAGVSRLTESGVELTDGSSISSGLVICAAGTQSLQFFPELPMRPRKGHLAISDRYPGFVHHQLVELGYLKSAHGHSNESVAFNIQPRSTGQVLIGSSRQYGETRGQIDPHMLQAMLARATEYMPALSGLSIIRTWTGFRAATEDKLPLIGPAPGVKNVLLATGHEGLGITTSLATGRLIADLVANRASKIPHQPYLPSRLIGAAHV